jgi:hypothetical protein
LSFSSSEEDLHILIPTKRYQNAHNLTRTTCYNPATHFLTFVVSADQSLPAETNTYSKEDTSFSLAVKIKVLLVENLEASTFKAIP